MRTTAIDGSILIEGRAHLSRPHDEVIDRILDPSTWPLWQPEIVSTKGPARLQQGDSVEGRADMLGFVVAGRSTAVEVGPDRFEEDVVVGVRMRIRYEVAPTPGGCELIQVLTADLPEGVAGRVLSFLLRRRLERMQAEALENLVAQCEAETSV
ncbi:MAG: SRPBCC family protein [Actinomycetota bacterium]